MNFKQKELVLLPYPFTDQEGNKVRPAVIISNDHFNIHSQEKIMIPITSVIKDEPYSIIINQADLLSGNLQKPSRIRCDKIFTINQYSIIMKFGKINDKTSNKILSEVKGTF